MPLILGQDFEDQDIGEAPEGWNIAPTGGATIQNDPEGGSPNGKVVRVYGGGESVFCTYTFTNPVTSGKVRVRAFMRSDDVKGAGVHFHFNFGAAHSTERAGFVSFDCDGNIYYSDSQSDFNLIGTFDDDRWYAVELHFNIETETYDIWIDGDEKVAGASWRTSGSSINSVKFDLSYSKTAYFDNVYASGQDCQADPPSRISISTDFEGDLA